MYCGGVEFRDHRARVEDLRDEGVAHVQPGSGAFECEIEVQFVVGRCGQSLRRDRGDDFRVVDHGDRGGGIELGRDGHGARRLGAHLDFGPVDPVLIGVTRDIAEEDAHRSQPGNIGACGEFERHVGRVQVFE